ncbi:MAG: hypothetical protein U1F43_10125 [Myxococcota bacterium]
MTLSELLATGADEEPALLDVDGRALSHAPLREHLGGAAWRCARWASALATRPRSSSTTGSSRGGLPGRRGRGQRGAAESLL